MAVTKIKVSMRVRFRYFVRRNIRRIKRPFIWLAGTWVMAPYRTLRMWWWRRQLNKSIRVLDTLEWYMHRAGWNRTQKRQFWRDFTKRRDVRTGTLNSITQR